MAEVQRKKVNGINTVVMHGKNYVEVAERVRLVHEQERAFEVIESVPFVLLDRVLWRVTVKVDERVYTGNAEAKLNARPGSPDATNPFECAETSALGRALAFAGFGSVESIASFDEVYRATRCVPESSAADTQEPSPLAKVQAFCEELYGPGKWAAVKASVLKNENAGDVPDELLSAVQLAKINGALVARQKATQQKAAAGK